MSATVASLMDGVHARAWRLCSTPGTDHGDGAPRHRTTALLASWPRLATAALRVLDAVRVEPAWLDDTATTRDVLRAVANSPALTTQALTHTVSGGEGQRMTSGRGTMRRAAIVLSTWNSIHPRSRPTMLRPFLAINVWMTGIPANSLVARSPPQRGESG